MFVSKLIYVSKRGPWYEARVTPVTYSANSCGSKGTMFGQLCDVIKERGSI